ncbi:hypothetical protein AzCIB_4697 [Azoarcus sp. CIB]|uniref:T6SS effector phospholipase Tle3 domain-containing protein n=1 Tax=Aromatoleum sp. (strain CIB) TaxID=198107 RepID=UPI00067C9F8D|nr:DUF3274 domain-containing protein [Azoarcus sp. CIB]AKU14582.1 hypothetical protein AzCIB_4697 [Azoarcus sp. CIB]
MTTPASPLTISYATPVDDKTCKDVLLQPDMPGIIIFVHGVNSEGEWYEAAEQHILAGLNMRLGRNDLTPREWDPDKAQPKPETSDRSPIIHFFWGYRPQDGEERRWRVPLRDSSDKRRSAWARNYSPRPPLYWGGGPFQNGCNNLPLLWSPLGFRRDVWAALIPIDVQKLNPEVDRQLQDAPPRTYYAHAAGRLAGLVRKIRGRFAADTITLIGHSQGTQIVLAALALLESTNQPDCVMLMNGPYAFDAKITDTVAQGDDAPTADARRKTFENIVRHFDSGHRKLTRELVECLRVGQTADGAPWTPSAPGERDNTGRMYIYFNPHDRVMGSTALQSIGWQGLPTQLLKTYTGTLYQRMLARSTPCGTAPGEQYLWPREPDGSLKPFWNLMKKTKGLIPMDLWVTPDRNQQVLINAEAVFHPIGAEEMLNFDDLSSTAKPWDRSGDYAFFRDIYIPERWMEERLSHDQSTSIRLETREEMEQRIGAYVPEPTDHSSLPMHDQFLTRVLAYDLPIGHCQSHQDQKFWTDLNRLADWRSTDPYFFEGTLDIPPMPPLIDTETFDTRRRQQEQTTAQWKQRSQKESQFA